VNNELLVSINNVFSDLNENNMTPFSNNNYTLNKILQENKILLNENAFLDKITAMSNYIKDASESKIKSFVAEKKKNQDEMFKKLLIAFEDNGMPVKETKKLIKLQSKKISKSIVKSVEAKNKTKTDNIFIKAIKEFIVNLKELTSMEKLKKESTLTAFVVLACVLFVSSVLMFVFAAMFGPMVGFILSAVIIAPITEEFAKYYTIKKDSGGKFLIMFNIFEFSGYIAMILTNPHSDIAVKIIQMSLRVLVVFLHYSSAAIQKAFIKKGKDDTGLSIAIASHSAYNAISVVIGSILSNF
jgi:hypothetical protein